MLMLQDVQWKREILKRNKLFMCHSGCTRKQYRTYVNKIKIKNKIKIYNEICIE